MSFDDPQYQCGLRGVFGDHGSTGTVSFTLSWAGAANSVAFHELLAPRS